MIRMFPSLLNSKFPDSALIYIRKVATQDLAQELQDQVSGLDAIFSVHRADGEQIALVADRNLALALAHENQLSLVSVH
jgi:hypothetical protein